MREIRARQLREEYERTHRRLTPRQVYERTLAQVGTLNTSIAYDLAGIVAALALIQSWNDRKART